MTDAITLRVITPERIVLDTVASSVKVPASDGSMGILPRHAAMVTALDAGGLEYVHDGRSHTLFVAGGFAEVRKNTLRVITEASERPTDIDLERVERAAERARERLRQSRAEGSPEFDVLRAEASLRRALMRRLVVGKEA
jgi:F-type H+-transporting ATPase subunit epsilon